ncbi:MULTISPECIES: ABC transporter permease subunit [Acidiphilium]|uniref:sn-glycerol-3-phosphate transport system permease protein UgpA n=1 Tax=Acidiphilium rubrum TaxID=526 RepID=A0A8G2CHX5_ACIRU|nr:MULTISPECIES: ABC transporter permease subunit [Acidiphilium]MBW4037156.1 ABC transporter permease subunit [Pseudomonadota bacterium]SIQ15634.1 sn-glycerol 3-phosphate transport system permease protein [Acidiphilium rubrum]
MERRTLFAGWMLPAVLVAPQLAITVLFFLLPAWRAFGESVRATDAFGLNSSFVGLANFAELFQSSTYQAALVRTFVFCIAVTCLAMGFGLLLASFANRAIRGARVYRILLIWPYAIAPAIASVIFVFLLQPQIGLLTNLFGRLGLDFNYATHADQAFLLVIVIAAWKQVSYNFIFYLAGLQSVPRSVIEAATLDGARGFYRFRTMIFPLLAPTTFFLIIVNIVYAAFDTFALIFALTAGGPGTATETLVVKVYRDGILNLDIGGSAAQSIILMVIIIGLTTIQFRYTGKRAG